MSKPKLKARVRTCPNCGFDLRPIITVNEKKPFHPADKLAKKVGIDCFFPHVDADYLCPCGFRWHETWSLKGKPISSSGGIKRDPVVWKKRCRKYKRAEVEIVGLTPLLMHRPDLERLRPKGRTGIRYPLTPEEEARNSAYIAEIDGKETLYIPSRAVYACILNMSKHFKIGKFRFSHLLAGSVRVEPEKIPLNKTEYEVYTTMVVIHRTKLPVARAKVWPWKAKFHLVTEKPLPIQQWDTLEEVIRNAGTMCGLLEYRPKRGGYFGMFRLKSFKVLEE